MTFLYFILALVILAGVILFFWIWANNHTNRVIFYFIFATIAYVITGKSDIYLATTTSASVIDKNSYPFVRLLLENLAVYVLSISTTSPEILDKRLSEIFMLIKNQEFSREVVNENKLKLSLANPKYANSLQNADPTVFAAEFPEIAKVYEEIQSMINQTRRDYYITGKTLNQESCKMIVPFSVWY